LPQRCHMPRKLAGLQDAIHARLAGEDASGDRQHRAVVQDAGGAWADI
jgi:hypothetical protein